MHTKRLMMAVTILALSVPVISSGTVVNAIGPSPAFQSEDDMPTDKLAELILNDVTGSINRIAPAMLKGYEETPLNKVLVTDYKEIDYPSITEGTNEGIDGDGNLVLSALKKPIKEASRKDLAELVRYYQYNMSKETSFEVLEKSNGVTNSHNDDVETKLNYFDYIKLIDAIANNSRYSNEEKVKRLSQVEKDLSTSISILYGDSNTATGLQAWGESKRVGIPFERDKFSYKQLLAAYEKDDVVIATLDYYSSILDTLEAIRQYSVDRRQGREANIDANALAANINSKYDKVLEVLVKPVAESLAVELKAEENRKAGQDEEQKALQDAGLVSTDE